MNEVKRGVGDEAGPEARWFGYRQVDPREKTGLVRDVFDRVARRYDLMNDLMSGGVHRLWKDRFVEGIRPRPGSTLLDVAGGTGDIAFRYLDRAGASAGAIICDINESMLRVGRDRAIDRGLVSEIEWLCGNAESLPVRDRSVDVYTIAFGLRNVTDIDAALAEARRVLKPGGRFYCLEFSRVTLPILRRAYDLYSFAVIPQLGGLVAHDRDSYRYLVESIRRFPDQESFVRRMEQAGIEKPRYRNLSGGIAAMHSGWRL